MMCIYAILCLLVSIWHKLSIFTLYQISSSQSCRWSFNWQNHCCAFNYDNFNIYGSERRSCSNGWSPNLLASLVGSIPPQWCYSACRPGLLFRDILLLSIFCYLYFLLSKHNMKLLVLLIDCFIVLYCMWCVFFCMLSYLKSLLYFLLMTCLLGIFFFSGSTCSWVC